VDSDDILDIIALRPSISINEPIILIIVVPKTILVPFQYSPMASIDSLDFVKKSYCADYGTVKKDYNSVKTGIDTVDRFLIDIF
jgi:hypothetical protein